MNAKRRMQLIYNLMMRDAMRNSTPVGDPEPLPTEGNDARSVSEMPAVPYTAMQPFGRSTIEPVVVPVPTDTQESNAVN